MHILQTEKVGNIVKILSEMRGSFNRLRSFSYEIQKQNQRMQCWRKIQNDMRKSLVIQREEAQFSGYQVVLEEIIISNFVLGCNIITRMLGTFQILEFNRGKK